VPSSAFLRARVERECVECGVPIMEGELYYRRRLLTLCLLCHGEAEGAPGSHLTHTPPPPSSIMGCHGHGDFEAKKRFHLTEFKKSTPSPTAFLCVGTIENDEFIPTTVCIQADTLEDQESIQAFLSKHGLRGDLDQG